MSQVAGPLPRFSQITDFLREGEHRSLLEWAISIRDQFQPATIYKTLAKREYQVDPERRIALTTGNIGPLEPMLRERLLTTLPDLMVTTGTSGPPPTSLELELAAHADGAYFRPHIDMPFGTGREPLGANPGEDRILSAVYYFYSEPKAFSGGQLRLYAFGPIPESGDQQRPHTDVEPVRNSLVAFPSWVPHEVRPISCPSCEFPHYRFALNCWYCRTVTTAYSQNG